LSNKEPGQAWVTKSLAMAWVTKSLAGLSNKEPGHGLSNNCKQRWLQSKSELGVQLLTLKQQTFAHPVHEVHRIYIGVQDEHKCTGCVNRVVFVGGEGGIFPVTASWHPRHWLVASHPRQGYYLSHAHHLCEQLSPLLHTRRWRNQYKILLENSCIFLFFFFPLHFFFPLTDFSHPPTVFLLPIPGRDVYFPPTENLNIYPPHWSWAQIPPCV